MDIKNFTNEELILLFKEKECNLKRIESEFGLGKNAAGRLYTKRGIDYNSIKKEWLQQLRIDYENNPKVCKQCGKPIPYERRENEFCSKSCAATFNNTKRNIDTSKLATISDETFINAINTSIGWKLILNNLGYSEKTNTKIKQKIQDRCILLNLKLNLEKTTKQIDWSTRTKKQLFEERSTWLSARTAIRRMALEIYAKSDKEYKCVVCGYDKHIEIAHIKAVSDFDGSATITEINDINNLIGLCPNHHWEYDNGLLDIQKYIK